MDKNKYRVFELNCGGKFSINGVDVTFNSKRSADKLCNLLNEINNEKLENKIKITDIETELHRLSNTDYWDYDKLKYTLRQISKIVGYEGDF